MTVKTSVITVNKDSRTCFILRRGWIYSLRGCQVFSLIRYHLSSNCDFNIASREGNIDLWLRCQNPCTQWLRELQGIYRKKLTSSSANNSSIFTKYDVDVAIFSTHTLYGIIIMPESTVCGYTTHLEQKFVFFSDTCWSKYCNILNDHKKMCYSILL